MSNPTYTFDSTPIHVEAEFNSNNTNWAPVFEYNLMFLRAQQNYANDLLDKRGHVFLNEVYDLLGIRRTAQGAIGGWLRDVNGGFIDFGVFGHPVIPHSQRLSIPLSFIIIPSMYTHI